MTRLLFASLLLLASCSSTPADSNDGGVSGDDGGAYAGAYLSPSCAPDDGPAVALRLYEVPSSSCNGGPTGRVLSFHLFDFAAPIGPGTTLSSGGSASACPGGEAPCRTPQSWSLSFESYAEGTGATGTYSISLDGETVSGRFDASWCDDGTAICG